MFLGEIDHFGFGEDYEKETCASLVRTQSSTIYSVLRTSSI